MENAFKYRRAKKHYIPFYNAVGIIYNQAQTQTPGKGRYNKRQNQNQSNIKQARHL